MLILRQDQQNSTKQAKNFPREEDHGMELFQVEKLVIRNLLMICAILQQKNDRKKKI
jgi:hypothetical protein